MKQIRGRVLSIISLLFLPFLVFASDAAISLVGVQGYDLVSYHQKNGVSVVVVTTLPIIME